MFTTNKSDLNIGFLHYNKSKHAKRIQSKRIKDKKILHKLLKKSVTRQKRNKNRKNKSKKDRKYDGVRVQNLTGPINEIAQTLPVIGDYYYSDAERDKQNRDQYEADNRKEIYKRSAIVLKELEKASSQFDPITLNMNKYNDQCLFWYNILDKLGIIQEMVYYLYLYKCTHKIERQKYDPSYHNNISFLSRDLIYTDHLFYILNETQKQSDWLFNKDYNNSNQIIMNRKQLIEILDLYNNYNIGTDICRLIVSFTVKNTNNILTFLLDYSTHPPYKQVQLCCSPSKPPTYINYKKYNHFGHQIIDACYKEYRHYMHSPIITSIRKIYDGTDITSHYKHARQILLKPFHTNYNNNLLNKILHIVWQKIRELFIINPARVTPNMIYGTMNYYVEHADVLVNLCFHKYKRTSGDYKKWCYLYNKLTSPICRNILVIINNSLKIASKQKQHFMNLVTRNVIKKISGNDSEFIEFCDCLSDNYCFINASQIKVRQKGKYHNYLCTDYPRFWTNIWKQISQKNNISIHKLNCLYKLMLKTVKELHRFNYNRNNIKEAILSGIIPVLLNKININIDVEYAQMIIDVVRHDFDFELQRYESYESLVSYIEQLNKKYLNLMWKFEDDSHYITSVTVNTYPCIETEWDYPCQKYKKRAKSKMRETRKKMIKTKNANKYWNSALNEKRKKELQRMRWIKYNNKKRQKNKYINYPIYDEKHTHILYSL